MKMTDIKRVVVTCGATEVAYDFDEKGELQVYLGTYISEAPKTDTLQRTSILPGFTQWAIEGDLDAWISVEDRLPPADTCVLCYQQSIKGYKAIFTAFCTIWPSGMVDWAVMYGGHIDDGSVTHWMRLPEPPEVDEQ